MSLNVGLPDDTGSSRGRFSKPGDRKYHFDKVPLRTTLGEKLREVERRNEFLEGDIQSSKRLLSELVQDMIQTQQEMEEKEVDMERMKSRLGDYHNLEEEIEELRSYSEILEVFIGEISLQIKEILLKTLTLAEFHQEEDDDFLIEPETDLWRSTERWKESSSAKASSSPSSWRPTHDPTLDEDDLELEEQLWKALVHSRRENLALKERLTVHEPPMSVVHSPEDRLAEIERTLKRQDSEIQKLKVDNQYLTLRKMTLEKQLDAFKEELISNRGEKDSLKEKILLLQEELSRLKDQKETPEASSTTNQSSEKSM